MLILFHDLTNENLRPLLKNKPFFLDPGTCSFDTGLCGYTQDSNDRFDWSRNNGSTPSWETGPDKDQSGTGKHLYTIDARWPKSARLDIFF